MSIFKNPNESNYPSGKKHFVDVIKNTGDGDLLIWKQPEEDFNTNSTLIVMPGERALFVNGGVVQQVFENGTYKLSTKNYPFLSRIVNMFSGGVSAFNCVVYFVKKADSKEILWGTQSPVQVRDKVYGIRTEVKARGAYKIRIADPTTFLDRLIGSNVNFCEQTALNKYFANEFQGKIKTALSKTLNSIEGELIGLDEHCDELSAALLPTMNAIVNEYGLECASFSIAGLDVDTSKYDTIDAAQLDAITTAKRAQGERQMFDILGKNWDKKQSAQILTALAKNEGASGLGVMGAGLGVGLSAAGTFKQMANDLFTASEEQPAATADPVATLKQLKELLDNGLIEQAEYDAKKAEILGKM